MKTRLVRYDVPQPAGGHRYVTLSAEQAIEEQKRSADRVGHVYPTDEDALNDFIVIHWADLEETE